MHKSICLFWVLLGVLSVVYPHDLYGVGIAIQTQGPTALGQGNSVIAHTDDPSTIYFNPALINKLPGTQIELGTTLIAPSTKFTSDATGKEFRLKDEKFFPSTLFATHRFNDRLSAGLGIFSNFGLSTDWGDTWEGRYVATKSEMNTYTVNPVVSLQVTPRLAVASGVDVLFLNTDLNKMLNLSSLGIPDTAQQLKGDATGVGYNVGLLWDITKDLSIGASYRSRIRVNINGDVIHSLPADTPPDIAVLFPRTRGRATITLPATASFGIAFTGLTPLTLEVGGRWEGWSSFKELRVTTEEPVAGENVTVEKWDWRDVYSFNLGAKYQLTDTVAILAGYIHENSPIPDSTFNAALPDNDTDIFTVGANIKYKNFLFSGAYTYYMVRSRVKNNEVDDNSFDGVINPETSANGKYRTRSHILGVSITYTF